jgi:outer membrane receptor protein involved in Fe transport
MQHVSFKAVCFSTLTLCSSSILAGDNESSVLDEITVTATRSAEKSTDIPASIDAKQAQEIALDVPVLQKELFNSIAGVRVTQTGSTIGHMTSIRMPTNTGPYYLMLQDGIPVQSSGFFNHNGLAYTNYSSAGSLEVLKGAGTALYGSDAIAATINVISKPPSGEKAFGIKPEAGSDGFYRLGVNGSGILSEKSDWSADVSHAESDGWRDHTAYKRDELSIQHYYDANENNSFKTVLSANQSDAEMSGSLIGLDALENTPESVGDIQKALDSGLEIKRKFDFARLSTEWTHDISNTNHLSTIVYLRSNRNRYTATWEKNLPHNDSKTKTLGLLFKTNIEKGKLNMITGIDAEYTKASNKYTQLFDYVPTGFGSPVATGTIYDYDVNYYAIAPYLRTEYDISNKLQIGAGLRYDSNGYDYTNNIASGQYAESSYLRASSNNDPDFSHLSPKLDISYKPSDTQLIYGRYANGFRIPQASRLYNLKTNNIDFNLDPETTDTFEIGYKARLGKHQLGTSLYQITIDDTIVRRENEAGERYYVNGRSTTHKGLEVSLSSQLTEQFSSKVAYSYSKHEYDNDGVYGDNEQAAAPNDVANVRFTYKPKQLKGLTSMLEWEHVGSYWLDDKNTKKYDGYDVANLKLSYESSKKLKLFAKVNNISDKTYAESASISYGKEKYTPASPRQFFLGMEYNW